MTQETHTLELLTPCFCAGADPAKAEIRAPSIRGQLRWWFRVLGGSHQEEAEVFGSVAGEHGRASAVCFRVEGISKPAFWNPPQLNPNSNLGYLLYFASKSSEGERWKNGGALAPGHQFKIHIHCRKKLAANLDEKLTLAWSAFLAFGAIGYRATRGLGAFHNLNSQPRIDESFEKIRSLGFLGGFSNWSGAKDDVLPALGAQLRGLRQGFSATRPGPLGGANPRQASAVRMRPIRESNGNFRILVFEAPKEKILGDPSKSRAPRLNESIPDLMNPPAKKAWK
jgi:hypothetical protein